MNLDQYFSPYVKINSKCTIDIHVKPKNLKLLEENIRERNLCDPGLGMDILEMTQKAVSIEK